ncbi:CHASE2 domain-containing protein [Nostoc sp. TCL26-01]|uniref:CHASE2 domain-containing protein n=1 Tax=Nostoc sp. TCL26-01 TaxID=2576904 RepID=UPI0015BC5851|nr:CHASE2 domain-containing protein [Nostoc sp. TCL26-01]QLE59820.1 CHASE2 domain-containing protein [Nostoc sp. TCL26-01]
MNKCVLINLGNGSLTDGFPSVIAQLSDTQDFLSIQEQGSLPPAPELADAYRDWKVLYQALALRLRNRGKIEIVLGSPTNISDVNLERLSENLQNQLLRWLNAESFARIERLLTRKLQEEDQIRVIIATEDEEIRQLPWHLWHFLEDYPQAEIALSAPKFDSKPHSQTPSGTVRVLAVLGNSQGIDVDIDRRLLESLPRNAELVLLRQPHRQELNQFLWEQKGWDILFFAGHSRTEGERGRIFINEADSLTIDELKHALKTAIAQGLQLAIFNSCEGLGLARQLADLHIPQVVVMKESVADPVAHEFLQHFLELFAGGKSFYLSVRQAREKLQAIEQEYPCASWLPVICQNPATIPPTWQQLCYQGRYQPFIPVAVSVVITALVIGIRALGILQAWELSAYDQLMRSRPDEGTDPHLLIVTATQQDIEQHGGYPLPDRTLAQAIEKLNQYQPQFIALDIIRDRPREPGYQELMKLFRQQENLIAICSHPDQGNPEKAGFKAPPGIIAGFLGFSDIVADKVDQVIRRHLLSYEPNQTSCPTDHALSTRLAFLYLTKHNIEPKKIFQSQDEDNSECQDFNSVIRVGETIFQSLPKYLGAYQQINNCGFQILLNYRTAKKPFEVVTLSEVLQNQVKPELVKDKAILIGVTDPTGNSDYHDTPLGKQPGVILQAHMTSQIINAVLDRRPLLKVWQLWQETFWILTWAAISSSLTWRFEKLWINALVIVATMAILYSICLFLLVQGWWMPLVSSGLAVVSTSTIIFIYRSFLLQKRT